MWALRSTVAGDRPKTQEQLDKEMDEYLAKVRPLRRSRCRRRPRLTYPRLVWGCVVAAFGGDVRLKLMI